MTYEEKIQRYDAIAMATLVNIYHKSRGGPVCLGRFDWNDNNHRAILGVAITCATHYGTEVYIDASPITRRAIFNYLKPYWPWFKKTPGRIPKKLAPVTIDVPELVEWTNNSIKENSPDIPFTLTDIWYEFYSKREDKPNDT